MEEAGKGYDKANVYGEGGLKPGFFPEVWEGSAADNNWNCEVGWCGMG